MNIINLTPHPIAIENLDGELKTFAPSGTLVRVSTVSVATGEVAGFATQESILGKVTGLPRRKAGTMYLVSGLVLSALKGSDRDDVFAPATGPSDRAVRTKDGQIQYVTRLNEVAE